MFKRLILAVVLVLSGCAQYSVREMTDEAGKPIGLTWHGFRQTGDFASWQHTSAITRGSAVQSFATDRGAGFIDPALSAAGMVGAGYFIGSGLKNADPSIVNQNQSQQQKQQIVTPVLE